MNIEVIEFYPIEHNEAKGHLTGTLRIKLPDLGIHILGVYITIRKNFWYFRLPGRKGIHHETGHIVPYPFIVFEDREQQEKLMSAIKKQGREFIERRLTDIENPLVFPTVKPRVQQATQPGKQPKPQNDHATATKAKKTVSIVQLTNNRRINCI